MTPPPMPVARYFGGHAAGHTVARAHRPRNGQTHAEQAGFDGSLGKVRVDRLRDDLGGLERGHRVIDLAPHAVLDAGAEADDRDGDRVQLRVHRHHRGARMRAHHRGGAADAAGGRGIPLFDQAEALQLGDQRADRGAVQADLGGEDRT